MACIDECISERECRKFEEGIDNNVKSAMYKKLGKRVEFKKYLHGVNDAGTRSVLNEELEVGKVSRNVLCVVLSVIV